jgi:hypothetical protein
VTFTSPELISRRLIFLLGSPVGRWAGYFLMAHKKQLGGNKFISKVRVYKPDQGSFPYMVFYVDGPAPSDPSPTPQVRSGASEEVVARQNKSVKTSIVNTQIVKRSGDGKSVLREHLLRAKL